jgi:hypothetical protein
MYNRYPTNNVTQSWRETLDKEWDNDDLKENSLGISLTMKQFSQYGERLDEINSSREYRRFMNRLEKKSFGSSGRRYKKRIKDFPVIEYTNKRYHFHVIMEIPKYSDGRRMDRNEFKSLIKESWGKTDFGYREIDIQDLYYQGSNCGWFDYITKFQDSEKNRIDVENIR